MNKQWTPKDRTASRGWLLPALGVTAGALATLSMVGGVASAASPTAPPGGVYHGKVHRVCVVPKAHHASCLAVKQDTPNEPVAFQTQDVVPNAVPAGYGPTDLRSAYALNSSGSSAQTVAIVDAQDDPTAEADLGTYRAQYGLPACTTANGCFRKVNQNGAASPMPAADTGWAGEISLDLDMVSAICPNCHIVLVEANSATDTDLYTAENQAVALGAKYVSNSWGGSEYSGQTTDDAYFNHPGVAITASSGDSGAGAEYPATSRYVTAVGGTTLTRASNARGWTETAWNGAGSGCSAFDVKPTFQTVSTSCARRAEADVSAVADPNTGVAVYQTYGASGWNVYGGTSVAAPVIASIYALAGTPGASDSPNSYPYAHAANLNDVTSGSNGSCGAPICTAGTGWDGPTGLGTPNGTAAFTATPTSTVTVNNPGSKSGTVGTAISSFTVTASGGTGSYTWTATGLPTGLSISTAGVVSGTPTTAGTYSVTATARDTNGSTGSALFTFTISSGTSGCTAPGQKLGNPGFESGNTVWSTTPAVIGQNAPSEPAHTGTWNAWLDGYGTTHTDTVNQSVTIPAGCTSSTLSFYLHVDTAETTTTTAFDKLTVKLGATVLGTFSNLNHATGYQAHSFPVGSYAGQTLTLTFSGTEDVSLQTSFVLDDTAVTAA